MEDDPDGFRKGVSHKTGFDFARDVHVHAIHSLVAMVLEVVLLEGDRHGHTNWEVSKDSKEAVVDWSGEGKVVTELMNG